MSPPSRHIDPNALKIRDACADDAGALASVMGRVIGVPEIIAGADQPCDRMWLAELNGADAPVGLVGLKMVQDHTAEIHDLWVCEDCRGCGVGVRLMETCLGYCQDHGVLKTVLHAEDDETAAIHLFQKVGFQLARQRPSGAGERLEFYMDLYRDENVDG